MKIQTLIFIFLVSSLMAQNTFTITNFLVSDCNTESKEKEYFEIAIQGTLGQGTTSETKWTPTFTSPKNPTATCRMNATEQEVTGTIECNITSAIDKEDVVLTTLKAEGFKDVTLHKNNQTLSSGIECNNDDNSSFISFSKLLLLFVFLLF